ALTRQAVAPLPRGADAAAAIRRGGYVLSEAAGGAPEAVIIATGSEVGPALAAQRQLGARGRRVRVVSMPCTSVFEAQDAAWRDAVLPPELTRRVAVEAGVSGYWRSYVGDRGRVIGLDRFGESAPGAAVMQSFGFTAEH